MAAERRGALARIGQLLAVNARMDLLWVLRSPSTAIAWYVSDAIVSLGLVMTTLLIAERFDGIGSWSKSDVLFMLAYSLVVRGIIDFAFGMNIAFISRRIGRGQLDHMLVQPQPLWITFLTDGFTPISGSGTLIAGGVLGAIALGHVQVAMTPAWVALAVLNVAASTVVVLAFGYAWASAAFWAPRAAEEINSSSNRLVDQLRVFPLDGVGGVLLVSLLTFVPVGFVAWWPARALLASEGAWPGALVTPAASLVLAGVAAFLFSRGLAHYGRTGSSRYLSLGHRR